MFTFLAKEHCSTINTTAANLPEITTKDRALRSIQGYQAINNLSSLPFEAGGNALVLMSGFKRKLPHSIFICLSCYQAAEETTQDHIVCSLPASSF